MNRTPSDPTDELTSLSATELLAGYRSRAFSPVEVVDAVADRVADVDPIVGAFTTMCLERARREAKSAESAYLGRTGCGSLLGVPFAAKDIFDTAELRTSYGSRLSPTTLPARTPPPRGVRAMPAAMLAHERAHHDEWLHRLEARVGQVREHRRRLDPVRRQLDAYLEGRPRSFELPIDWRLDPGGFLRRALGETARIPFGEVRTHQELAAAAGNSRAARAAGTALARKPVAIVIPCHRVLRTDGTIGDYASGPEGSDLKRYLLRFEGAWPAAPT